MGQVSLVLLSANTEANAAPKTSNRPRLVILVASMNSDAFCVVLNRPSFTI